MKLSLPPQPPALYTVVHLMNIVDAILYILTYVHKMPLNLIVNMDILCSCPSIRDGVLRSGMLLYLHHINFKIFFHPTKFDNFKDEKISDFKTVSVSQRKNLLD